MNRCANASRNLIARSCSSIAEIVGAELHARPIPPGRRARFTHDYTDNEMLAHQTGLQHPRIALRRLFSNAGSADSRLYALHHDEPHVGRAISRARQARFLTFWSSTRLHRCGPRRRLARCFAAIRRSLWAIREQLPPTDFFIPSDDSDDQQAEDAPEKSILELGAPLLASDAHAGSSLPFAPPQPNSLFQPRVLRRALARLSKPRDGGPRIRASPAGKSMAPTRSGRAAILKKRVPSSRKLPR